MPPNAIGIEMGNRGWKKNAVRTRFPEFENMSAMSRTAHSYNLKI